MELYAFKTCTSVNRITTTAQTCEEGGHLCVAGSRDQSAGEVSRLPGSWWVNRGSSGFSAHCPREGEGEPSARSLRVKCQATLWVGISEQLTAQQGSPVAVLYARTTSSPPCSWRGATQGTLPRPWVLLLSKC